MNTENEKLKKEIQILKSELGRTKKENTEYLQNVAHQLTAPLHAIKWGIEVLKDPTVSIQRKQKLLSSVYSQSTILIHLIKNFSFMSNLQADLELGQFREQPEEIEVKKLAINLANDFQPQAFDLNKKIIVNEDSFESTIGNKKLSVEKNLIAQAISNVLENAVKYSFKDTTIVISAAINENFKLCIESKGIEIQKDEINQIFERGVRGKAASQIVPAGTGFGLYLVERIMRLHHGSVAVAAKDNVTVFYLVFPLERIV